MAEILPPSEDTANDEYVSRPGQDEIPVVSDNSVEQVDTTNADSDEQLARDDNDAIDESNIIDQKTRGAGPKGGYAEPEEDDLEAVQQNDGTSSGAAQ